MGTVEYYYTNTALADTVGNSGGLSATGTTLTAGSLDPTGYPQQYPWKLRIEPGTPNEELVKVDSGSGTAGSPWVIERGWDGTLPSGHDQGVAIAHGMTQEDLALSRAHEAADSTGTFVGGVLDPATLPHGLPSSAWQVSSMALLGSMVLPGNKGSASFSGIPQTYSNLMLVVFAKSTDTTGRDDGLNIVVNGDAGASYSAVSMFATDGTPSGGGSASDSQNAMQPLVIASSATGAVVAGGGVAFFPAYSGTTFGKGAIGFSGVGQGNSSSNYSLRIRYCFYRPSSQVGITSLTLTSASGQLKAGSSFSLYGLG